MKAKYLITFQDIHSQRYVHDVTPFALPASLFSFASPCRHSFFSFVLHGGNDHTNFRHLYATRLNHQRGSTVNYRECQALRPARTDGLI